MFVVRCCGYEIYMRIENGKEVIDSVYKEEEREMNEFLEYVRSQGVVFRLKKRKIRMAIDDKFERWIMRKINETIENKSIINEY